MELNIFIELQSVCKFMFYLLKYSRLLFLLRMCVFLLAMKKCGSSTIISDLSKYKQNSNLVTSYPVKLSRSLLDCSQFCTSTGNCCGFSYQKVDKTCGCLYSDDFVSPIFEVENETDVYLHKDCDHLAETSSSTSSTTAPPPPPPTTTTSSSGGGGSDESDD